MKNTISMGKRVLLLIAAMLLVTTVVTAGAVAAPPGPSLVFDDMEHGDPGANGWFSFGGSVGGGGISANAADLPPLLGGAWSLETGWGSGGVPGFYGGFGRTAPSNLAGLDYFNFWINPNAGQDYTLEINLQDDDNGDGAINPPDDDEFQFNCVVAPAGPCAESGGGWQFVSVPLADFAHDPSFLFGGTGVLDAVPTPGGNGELINIVVAVIGNTGSDANFRTDYWSFSSGPLDPGALIIDDFESGLPSGTDGNGIPIGFYTFQGAGSSIALATSTTPPAPVPGAATPNAVFQMDVDVTSFAGAIHGFSDVPPTTWVSQDWSRHEGFALWLYGTNSGTDLFIDLLENRNPGSTTDDAERWTVAFKDDFTGWQYLEFPFTSFTRKEIGNGAPADGLTLQEVHGWALGTLGTGGPSTYHVDDVSLFGVAEVPPPSVTFVTEKNFVTEGDTGEIAVKLNRPLGVRPDDPAQVTVDYATEPGTADPDRDYLPTAGTLTFVEGGPSELTFSLVTIDNEKFTGDKRVVLRLSNPVGAEPGAIMQASGLIVEDDDFDPLLIDDFEQGAYLWETAGPVYLDTPEIDSGDPLEVPGQGTYETVLEAASPGPQPSLEAAKQAAIADLAGLVPGASKKDAKRIDKAIERIGQSLDPDYWVNGYLLDRKDGKKVFDRERQAVKELEKVLDGGGADTAAIQAAIDELVAADRGLAEIAIALAEYNGGKASEIEKAYEEAAKAEGYSAAGRYDKAIEHYRKAWERATKAVKGLDLVQADFGRDFAIGNDWSGAESLSFWYYGTGEGGDINVLLKDNRAPDPGPTGWSQVWSDEFNDPAGTPPNPDNWSYELGDVTPDGKNGWGNEELQYYTDDPANAATDGAGNLVLTVEEADGSLQCYYGPCEYTSARLISWYKAEFAYGRVEARLQVPQGAGLWPAFWSLGTDINRNPWPQAGEIDIMEFVGRQPNEIFGTIHGPGYSGGGSFGDIYDFGEPVFNGYHTFAVEWQPGLINWYVDDIPYHTATPPDVAPNEWVFEHPFFLLLNVAVGGNFGGPVGEDTTFPQSMAVDYVRVFQGPDTAERFEASFVDDFIGWQQVAIPFGDFARSTDQPDGAPDDGLGLTDVWGYGFELPYPSEGPFLIDQVRLNPVPPPTEIIVTNLDNDGDGSLRDALARIADGGTITFDPGLAGGTIGLTSGQLIVNHDVTIDGSGAPGLVVSGSNASRVFEIGAGAAVSMGDLVVTDGVGEPQGGGIRNLGALSLERVTITANSVPTGGGANFEFGGGGIYNGDGATLDLTDSTVSDNSTATQPAGGIYGFFNSSITITRSTVSGNTAGDVAGGLRSLGDVTITNSTFSGNVSTAWHGGAIFHTDGQLTVTNSTFAANTAPAGTAAGIVVATFGGGTPNLTLTNSIVADNVAGLACAIENQGGAGTITSGGGNIDDDGSCNLTAAGDQPNTDPLLGPLADNGGPTPTHALVAGSPAIDAANAAACPATDQRGVSRPQGGGCDVGAFELQP